MHIHVCYKTDNRKKQHMSPINIHRSAMGSRRLKITKAM